MPTPKNQTALAVAVGSGKIGFVFLRNGKASDWGMSVKASQQPASAVAKVQSWIEFYCPDLIVTERLSPHTRKSGRTLYNIAAIADLAAKDDANHVEVERFRKHTSKYEEMDDLALRYPELENWKPNKRRPWESEPKTTVIWEALSLVDQLKG